MKSIRFPILLFVLVAVLLSLGGCDKHYVDVYINKDGKFVQMDNDPDNYIRTLVVFPGDFVAFNSMRDKKITLGFPEGLFETTSVVLEPGHRVILEVLAKEPMEGDIGLAGEDIPSTGPKVKVGEGP